MTKRQNQTGGAMKNGSPGSYALAPNTSSDCLPLVYEAPMLAGVPVPLHSPQGLTHIGSLDPAEKKAWSLEGQGLSVSQHPEAWGRIARLGGPVWAVGRSDAKFLNYHELSKKQQKAIAAWGTDRGYVKKTLSFKIATKDEDGRKSWYMTTEQSDVDSEREEAYEYESYLKITETAALITTDAFPDPTVKTGRVEDGQILATLWVAEEYPALDGVWWEDALDVDALSAPRGVIIPARIAEWVASAIPYEEDANNDEDFDGF